MTLQQRAAALADNWRSFQCFAWDGPYDDGCWAVVYTHHRDSDLIDRVNAEVLAELLEPHLGPDLVAEHHRHWAVGWLDGYALRVFDERGEVTPACTAWHELQCHLEEYPLLDEARYAQRDHEQFLERLAWVGQHLLEDADHLVDDWPGRVFDWLWEHEQHELLGCPSEEAVRRAVAALHEGVNHA